MSGHSSFESCREDAVGFFSISISECSSCNRYRLLCKAYHHDKRNCSWIKEGINIDGRER